MWGPVFADVFDGSMCGAGSDVFAVWVYCIAHGYDGGGVVRINPKLLATVIGSAEEKMVEAIEYLCAPDKQSASKKDGGARLLHISGHEYGIVNWDHYQDIIRKERKRAADRERMREKRATAKSNDSNGVANVANRRKKSPIIRDDKIEEDKIKEHTCAPRGKDVRKNEINFEEFWKIYPRSIGKKKAKSAWENLSVKNQEEAMAALPKYVAICSGKEKQFILHPATWIHGERWNDELEDDTIEPGWMKTCRIFAGENGFTEQEAFGFFKSQNYTPSNPEEVRAWLDSRS